MEYQSYQGSVHQLRRLNRYLVIALIALSIAIIAMSFCIYRAIGHKTVTLVPPVLSQQISLSDVTPDQSYIEQMGLFLSSIRLNVTPKNAKKNFDIFLSHVAPESYGYLSSLLYKEEAAIKKGDISAVFYPTDQYIDLNKSALVIDGRLDKYSGERKVSSKEVRFEVVFDYRDGSLLITDFHQVATKKG